MDVQINGKVKREHQITSVPVLNGYGVDHAKEEIGSIEDLERELPFVNDEQISLGDITSRLVHAIYAELSELAET